MLRTATLAPSDVISEKDISCLNDTYLSSTSSSASRGPQSGGGHFTPLPIARKMVAIAPVARERTQCRLCVTGAVSVRDKWTIVETDKRLDREKLIEAMERSGLGESEGRTTA